MKSCGRSMPAFLISVCVNAVIVTGTSSIRSSRWRAVTTISSSWPAGISAACSTVGTASERGTMRGSQGEQPRLARLH